MLIPSNPKQKVIMIEVPKNIRLTHKIIQCFINNHLAILIHLVKSHVDFRTNPTDFVSESNSTALMRESYISLLLLI